MDGVSVLCLGLLGRAIFEAGAGGQPVALPVAGILAVMATTLGARVHPDWLAGSDHPTAG